MNDTFTSDLPELNGNRAAATLSERVRELRLPPAGSMKGKGGATATWLPWVLCILLALAWGSMGIRYYRSTPVASSTSNPTTVATTEKAAPTISSVTPPTGSSSDNSVTKNAPADTILLEGRGNVIPAHQISVSPVDVVGRITELYIEEGKSFKEGDVLAVIDSTKYRADYELAVASADAAKARFEELRLSRELQVEQAEFEVQFSKRSMEKAKNIYDINRRNYDNRSKSVSEMEVMQSDKDYQGATMQVSMAERKRDLIKGPARDEQIKAAESEWRSALARVAQTKWFLDNCTIKSPVSGIILTKKAERGNLINPVVGGVSTNLCEIADLSDLEVDLEIQERDLKKFFVGQACRVKADAYPDRMYDAYVDRAMPIANRAKGVLPVRIKIIVPPTEEQGKYLKPEMGMTVYFLNKTSTEPRWLAKQAEINKVEPKVEKK